MKNYLLFIVSFIILSSFLLAQNSEDEESFKFGIAATLETSSDVFQDEFHRNTNIGFSKILLPVIFKSLLKIEPEVGYRSRDVKFVDYKLWQLGLGIYYFSEYNDINFYLGPRFGFEKLTSPLYSREDEMATTTSYNYGITLGSEYFLSKHFSVGSEVQINKYIFNGTDSFAIKLSHVSIIPGIYLSLYLK